MADEEEAVRLAYAQAMATAMEAVAKCNARRIAIRASLPPNSKIPEDLRQELKAGAALLSRLSFAVMEFWHPEQREACVRWATEYKSARMACPNEEPHVSPPSVLQGPLKICCPGTTRTLFLDEMPGICVILSSQPARPPAPAPAPAPPTCQQGRAWRAWLTAASSLLGRSRRGVARVCKATGPVYRNRLCCQGGLVRESFAEQRQGETQELCTPLLRAS